MVVIYEVRFSGLGLCFRDPLIGCIFGDIGLLP